MSYAAETRSGGSASIKVRDMQRMALFLLGISSFVAFIEPSPFEALFTLVLAVFVLTGGLRLDVSIVPLALALFLFIAGGLISLIPYLDEQPSVTFTAISAYLAIATLVFASMLRMDAEGRLDALRRGYIIAAMLASIAGILGYFNIAGLGELFTRYDRASGTFKDPNVLGTYVILPLMYLVRAVLTGRARAGTYAAIALIMFGGVFLSFSRGAWGCMAGSAAVMAALEWHATSSRRTRRRILAGLGGGIAFVAVGLGIALSFSSISTVFQERAALVQDYDVNRFGKLTVMIPLLMESPNGLGPLRFHLYSSEDPHDVYVNAFSSYGWLGGFAYIFLVVMTIVAGWKVVRTPSPLRSHAIVIGSTLFVEQIQGFQIDTDHWRHFWLMTGLLWGMIPAVRESQARQAILAARDGESLD